MESDAEGQVDSDPTPNHGIKRVTITWPLTNATAHPASTPNPMAFADQYHYRVSWSEDDQAFVGRVDEFPSLSAHGETLAQALEEVVAVVQMAIEDLKESGEEVPQPGSLTPLSPRTSS